MLLPDLFYRSRPYERASMAVFGDPEKRKQWFEKMMGPANTAAVMSDTTSFLDRSSS